MLTPLKYSRELTDSLDLEIFSFEYQYALPDKMKVWRALWRLEYHKSMVMKFIDTCDYSW